jgi:GTP cyclohydrolase I
MYFDLPLLKRRGGKIPCRATEVSRITGTEEVEVVHKAQHLCMMTRGIRERVFPFYTQ